ncbi:hypothetical protein V2G26_009261 [Clonostachys chloroleuca]
MISPTSCAVLQETKSSPAKRKRQHQPSVGGLRRKVTRVGGRVAGLCTGGPLAEIAFALSPWYPSLPLLYIHAACATPETPTNWEGGSSVPLIDPCPLLLPSPWCLARRSSSLAAGKVRLTGPWAVMRGQKQILPPAQSGTNQPSTRPIHCRCTNGLI